VFCFAHLTTSQRNILTGAVTDSIVISLVLLLEIIFFYLSTFPSALASPSIEDVHSVIFSFFWFEIDKIPGAGS
jgi:hypothetical protein